MLAKKINAKLKRAYYYFGFEEVVCYDEVKPHMELLKGLPNDESLSIKINEYADEIEEFFNTDEKKADSEFTAEFAKDEPRKSWEHYTENFPEDIFEGGIEPVEEVPEENAEIEAVEEDDLEDVGELEAVEEDDVVDDGELEAVEDEVEEYKPVNPAPSVQPKPNKTKIYINGELLGYCDEPENFTQK